MNTITSIELRQLATVQDQPCISIFMPIDASGVERLRDRGVLKSLIEQAADKLQEAGYGPELSDACLRPARALLDKEGLRPFRAPGLALFLSPKEARIYATPSEVPEVAMVCRRFYIRPLLSLLEQVGQFWLLALSQQRVRLFEVTHQDLREIPVPGMPQTMEQGLNEQGVDRGEQVHAGSKFGTGKEAAVFHGQGGIPDAHKDQLLRYFRQVDAALKPVLAGQSIPLLLAAIDAHVPLYRLVNSYEGLLADALAGNMDYETTTQLLKRAWAVAKPQLDALLKQRLAKYADLQSHGRASADLHKVLGAAFAGKIETIFVDPLSRLWGAYHPATARAEYHDRFAVGDDDLVDVAARETWLHGGHVFVLPRAEMPDGAPAAAIYRY